MSQKENRKFIKEIFQFFLPIHLLDIDWNFWLFFSIKKSYRRKSSDQYHFYHCHQKKPLKYINFYKNLHYLFYKTIKKCHLFFPLPLPLSFFHEFSLLTFSSKKKKKIRHKIQCCRWWYCSAAVAAAVLANRCCYRLIFSFD